MREVAGPSVGGRTARSIFHFREDAGAVLVRRADRSWCGPGRRCCRCASRAGPFEPGHTPVRKADLAYAPGSRAGTSAGTTCVTRPA